MNIELPPVVDPVGEALHFLRMSGTFYCRSEFGAPWALALPPMQSCLMLHVVTAGRCFLELQGTPSRLLQSGDLVLVPHGEGHVLTSAPGLPAAKLFEIPREQVSERYERLRLGGDGERATVICGLFKFDDPAAQQLITLLPKIITVDASASPQSDWIQSTLRMIAAEAKEMPPGGETVIMRLADILVIHAIRFWITHNPSAQTGWLGALQDPKIGRVISKIHRNPGRAWTLESLASEASMSRSAFAARFTELVGESAMRYVTRWRMSRALVRLAERNLTVAEVANSLGYESEAAFNRAFKRHVGMSPGVAKQARTLSTFTQST
ncbi:MAG TPA: AraC family transcriptional regulator [Edaphobacter sp.]|nr:AraC family transcriptional regulator [Edaphobacter sp.]